MGFYKRNRTQDIRAAPEQRAEQWLEADGALELFFKQATSVSRSFDKDEALGIPALAGCLEFICGIAASVPVRLYEVGTGEGQEEEKEVTNDPRLAVLNDDTGDLLTGPEWKKAFFMDYLLRGRAWAYQNMNLNRLESLHYVDDRAVSVCTNEDPVFKRAVVNIHGRTYQPWQFIHMARNTTDGVRGVGLLEQAKQQLSMALNYIDFENALVKGGGSKRGFLQSERKLDAEISKSTQDYNVAIQDAGRLSDKIQQLQGVYDTVKNATAGMDLSKPLDELVVDAERALTQIESKRRKIEEELQSLSASPKGGSSKRAATLQAELNLLAEKSKVAVARLDDLDRAADAIGADNLGYASAAGLKELESQIAATKAQLSTTKTLAEEAKQKLWSMGEGVSVWQLMKAKIEDVKTAAKGIPAAFTSIKVDPVQTIADGIVRLGNSIKLIPANILGVAANGLGRIADGIRSIPEIPGRVWTGLKKLGTTAAQAASGGVKKLWSGLKNLAGSAVRGIASIPSKLKKIGSSASSSCGGLGKMLKSIRSIGIASLGMRVASGMFGRLRSIISSYISENEELNSTVSAMKTQFGEALVPAINVVLAVMQKLMPVITAVSNGINSILTSLFGDMAKTTSAIKKAADEANSLEIYGFDQITKASDTSESSSSSASASAGSQSGLVQKLTNWIQQLKDAFVAGDWKRLGQLVGDGINSVFDSINAIDVGAKVGTFLNNVNTVLYGALTTIDFGGIGMKLGQILTAAIEQVDWNQAGNVIGLFLTALPSMLVGFILGTNWGTVGKSVSELLKSALSTCTEWIQNTDWLQIGQAAADLITGIDWSGIVSESFRFLGAAIGACVGILWGAVDDAVLSIKEYFTEKIEAAGGNVAKGLLNGILEGLGNIGTWISNNVTKPFVAGFSGLGNGVVDVIEKMINSVIKGINKLFGGLNSFLSLGKKVGLDLSIPTLKEVSLPRAATGTIVSKATDLTVGEDGTEAVVPLERHTEWLDVLASKLAVKVSGAGAATTVVLKFILGNRQVTEYVIKDINQITKENGVCPIRL